MKELGYRDYLGALQRYRMEHPTDVRLLAMSSSQDVRFNEDKVAQGRQLGLLHRDSHRAELRGTLKARNSSSTWISRSHSRSLAAAVIAANPKLRGRAS